MALTGTGTEDIQVAIGGDSSGLQSATSSAIDALGSMRGAAVLAGGALAGLAAKGIAEAVSAAAEFESQLADLEKVTSAELVEPLRQGIMGLAEEIPMSRKGLVELATQAGKFGAETEEEIMAFVENVGMITSATDLAAEEAGTRFAKIAGAVGLPMSEIGKLGNAVNSLADSMKTDAGEITDTANRAANILSQQFGLGEDVVLSLSASMNEVSSSSRLAAGHLKRAAESLMDPKKVSDISGALGMTVDKFRRMREENPQKLMNLVARSMAKGGQTAQDLSVAMGTQATRAFSLLGTQLDRTKQAQQTVNQQFENGTSLQREMSIRTDTAAGKWQLLSNKVQNAATRIGDRFLPVAKSLLDGLIRLTGVFATINKRTDGMAGAVTLVTALVGGLVVALGSLYGILLTSTTAAAAASGAVGALGTAFTLLTGPVGLAVALIAGLAIAWRKNLFDIQGKTKAVIAVLRSVIQSGLQFISSIWSIHSDALGAETGETFAHIQNVINDFVAWVRPFVNEALAALSSFWDSHGEAIKQIIDVAFTFIKTVIGTQLDAALTIIRAILALIRGDFGDFKDIIIGFIERTVDRVVGLFRKLKRLLVGNSIIPNMLAEIISAFTGFGSDVLGWLGGMVGDFMAKVREWKDEAVGKVGDLASDALGKLTDKISAFRSAGKSLIQGVVDGIRDKIQAVKDAAGRVASAIRDRLPGSDAKEGPLSDLSNAGEAIPITLKENALSGRRELSKMAERLAAAAYPETGGDGGRRPTGTGGPGLLIQSLTIHASSREGGEEAADAFMKELRSGNF